VAQVRVIQCGRGRSLHWGRARQAQSAPIAHGLSIRAAWGGTQHCHVDGRTIAVDDDNFLILNPGRVSSTSIDATHPVETLTIFFGPDLAGAHEPEYLENLQPHDRLVSPVLRFIRAHLDRGVADEAWYHEQLLFLLERMRCRHARLQEQIDGIALIRPATRREAFRRIALATDYLHAHYSQNVDLDALARMAFLSKYHFLRLFTLIHGITPRKYLQRKRVDVAVRLLETTQLPVGEVTARVGFAFESTLLRQVRLRTKLSPRELRLRGKATQVRNPGPIDPQSPHELPRALLLGSHTLSLQEEELDVC
jgi:AraC-like DNA-binding protein